MMYQVAKQFGVKMGFTKKRNGKADVVNSATELAKSHWSFTKNYKRGAGDD
jgi:hypothetical protein